MKKLLVMVLLAALLLFCGCSRKQENLTQDDNEPEDTWQLNNITLDDQKQVEQLILSYFDALERKDYSAAWELTSPEEQESYPKSRAASEHWGFETIKLVSMQGYLPPSMSETGEVPAGTPTIWFEVKLDIIPSEDSTWDKKGINQRFVIVTRENDGQWRIGGLSTSPY